MKVFCIICGVVIYLLIVWLIFKFASEHDIFDEYRHYPLEFPIATFTFSIGWVIGIPLLLIYSLICWIAEEIESWGYAFAEVGRQKRRAKKKEGK